MKINLSFFKFCLYLFGASIFLISCDKEGSKDSMQFGDEVRMGDGEARSFIELDADDNPIAVGVTFSGSALKNLPAEVVYTFDFPDAGDLLPFKNLTIDWSDHGHDPPDVYDVPHFGFHFYYVDAAFRNGILVTDSTEFANAPEPKYIPSSFVQTPGGVPNQGAHWINTESSEWLPGGEDTFTETFLYGTYDGEITFLEPMATIDYIMTKPNGVFELKQPEVYPIAGYHPMSYTYSYDADKDEYTIALTDLVAR